MCSKTGAASKVQDTLEHFALAPCYFTGLSLVQGDNCQNCFCYLLKGVYSKKK